MKANEFKLSKEFTLSKENCQLRRLLFERLFRGCVKREGQVTVHKIEEKQIGFPSIDDIIKSEDEQEKVIKSYFKKVKIKELRIWKGDVISLAGSMVSDDGHLLIGDDESRKKNFQEQRERRFKLKS